MVLNRYGPDSAVIRGIQEGGYLPVLLKESGLGEQSRKEELQRGTSRWTILPQRTSP